MYISPDYPRIAVTQADKLNLGILKTADNLYGFLTEQVSSLDNGLCYSSDNPKLFTPSAKQWQQISESGQMFIDTLNHSGLVLNDDGAIFLNGNSYECKGLKQWLAPAGIVEAVLEQSVISSFDNAAVATYPQQGFHRELLTGKKLPISAKSFSGKRLSLGLNDKSIHVNSSVNTNGVEAIAWQNVYKQPVNIRKINSFSHDFDGTFANGQWPVFKNESIQTNSLSSEMLEDGYYFSGYTLFHRLVVPDPLYGGVEPFYVDVWEKTELGSSPGWARDELGLYHWIMPGASYKCSLTCFYINPNSGEPINFTVSTNFENSLQYQVNPNDSMAMDYMYDENIVTDCPDEITIQNGQIGYSYIHSTNAGEHSETRFRPLVAVSDVIPASVQNWQNNSGGNLTLQSIQIPKNIPQDIICPASAIFSEKNSKAIFACDIPSAFQSINGSKSGDLASLKNLWYQYYNYWNINSLSSDESFYTQGLHVAICESQNSEPLFIVFRSEIQPEIFDFKSQTERSKLS